MLTTVCNLWHGIQHSLEVPTYTKPRQRNEIRRMNILSKTLINNDERAWFQTVNPELKCGKMGNSLLIRYTEKTLRERKICSLSGFQSTPAPELSHRTLSDTGTTIMLRVVEPVFIKLSYRVFEN